MVVSSSKIGALRVASVWPAKGLQHKGQGAPLKRGASRLSVMFQQGRSIQEVLAVQELWAVVLIG